MYSQQLKPIALWYLVNKEVVPNAASRIESMVYRLAMKYPSSVRQKQYRSGLNRVARFVQQFMMEAEQCQAQSALETKSNDETPTT